MKDASIIKKHQRGFSTLEIMIAFLILSLTLTSVILVAFGNQSTSVDSQTNSEALAKAQAQLEIMRALARSDFSAVKNCDDSGATPCSGTLDSYYNRKVTVIDVYTFTKQVTSEVTYSVSTLRPQTVSLSTIVTDPQSAFGGDTCSPTLTGDWTNPQLLGTADVGGNNGGTDVDIFAKKAYVTTDSSSANKHDFYIIDVNNPAVADLPILGSIHTGPGLAAVHVAGQYAYVANISTVNQLQVIDVSNPSSPALVASLDVTAIGDTAVGNSIFYDDKKIYLGLTKSSGAEFYVVDVSNPLTPSVKASFEINSQINSIIVKNGIAYLAVPDDPATIAQSEQLKILDVSQADTGVITALNSYSPNPSTMSGRGLYLSKDGKTLYLGQGGANPGNKPEFFSLDVTSSSSISLLNSKYIPTSNDVSVNAISIRSNLAFLWTSDTNLGFQIWDLNNLGSATPYGSLNTQQAATGGFDCDGNFMYTAQRSQKALQIIGPGL